MVKGFIDYSGGKIPFVIENYRMELFTDEDNLLKDFIKENNFKKNYILQGQCYELGLKGKPATFLVEHSMSCICYLRCYIIIMMPSNLQYDTIGFQSLFLDDVFRYKYKYLDMVREGINLTLEYRDVYTIPFHMNNRCYKLKYRIGQDHRLGLLEDFNKKGEFLLSLQQINDIKECYDISMVLYRLAMFMLSEAKVPFHQITLYKDGIKTGRFYCPMVSENAVSRADILFNKFDIMKYVPKILNNIAIDPGNKITESIPLGHLGSFGNLFSPQRFLQQVMSFEYLFKKLEPEKAKKKAKNDSFRLKQKLKYMLDKFPQLLQKSKFSSDEASKNIKEMRNQITHGDAYYFDFNNDSEVQYLITLLDKLIKNMSLWLAGFSIDEIEKCQVL